jgi:esterase/lipase
MNPIIKISKRIIYTVIILLITIYFVRAFDARGHMQLRDEHRITLEHEYSFKMEGKIDWSQYLELESKLVDELANKINSNPGHSRRIDRHVSTSPANPDNYKKNWNLSYVLKPNTIHGAAVLLHGLTDSPYSVKSTAELLRDNGLMAFAPRMPGHGLAVGSLRQAKWEDWLSVTKIAMQEADEQRKPEQPLILVGYSNGGLLAVRYTLECINDSELPCPDGLILLSAAIEVSPVALLANLHALTSWLPYFEQFQWESVLPEVDPFKFTSFPKKPGWEIYQLVKVVEKELAKFEDGDVLFPPTIAFQSLVDDTVNSHAALKFVQSLPKNHHELVIYDVNQNEILVELMNRQPPNLDTVIREHAPYDFSVSVVTNRDPYTQSVHALELKFGQTEPVYHELNLEWPAGVFSLSHIALPFQMDDQIYGSNTTENTYNIGMMSPRGERGVLNLSPNYFSRLRHNPFYQYQHKRITDWLGQWNN